MNLQQGKWWVWIAILLVLAAALSSCERTDPPQSSTWDSSSFDQTTWN